MIKNKLERMHLIVVIISIEGLIKFEIIYYIYLSYSIL